MIIDLSAFLCGVKYPSLAENKASKSLRRDTIRINKPLSSSLPLSF